MAPINGEYWPARQLVQIVDETAPTVPAKLPALQLRHTSELVAAMVDEYWPAMQLVHVTAFAADQDPAMHEMHVPEPAVDQVPALQAVQRQAPVELRVAQSGSA